MLVKSLPLLLKASGGGTPATRLGVSPVSFGASTAPPSPDPAAGAAQAFARRIVTGGVRTALRFAAHGHARAAIAAAAAIAAPARAAAGGVGGLVVTPAPPSAAQG